MTNQQQGHRQQFGPYITLKVIGGSEHSAVYAAMHETTGKMVALRALTITARDVKQALADVIMVLDELSEFQIPNAVQIVDYGHEGETIYIAMTVLNGGTLMERMNRRLIQPDSPQFPSFDEVLELADRICLALDTLHKIGMVHGQIQPHSIMFNDRGQAFLTDIGLSRIFKIIYSLEASNSFNMTRYSPPELWTGDRLSPATDQYAFACIIYQLLTAQVPFDGSSIIDLMNAHTDDVAAPPHYLRKDLPDSLAVVFWQALAKPMDRRYETMRTFYQDLLSCFDNLSTESTDFFTFFIN